MVSLPSPSAQALAHDDKRKKQALDKAKATHLSKQLQIRLQYARLKIDFGWQKQNLNEVENLYFHHNHARLPKRYHSPKPASLTQQQQRREEEDAMVSPEPPAPPPAAPPSSSSPSSSSQAAKTPAFRVLDPPPAIVENGVRNENNAAQPTPTPMQTPTPVATPQPSTPAIDHSLLPSALSSIVSKHLMEQQQQQQQTTMMMNVVSPLAPAAQIYSTSSTSAPKPSPPQTAGSGLYAWNQSQMTTRPIQLQYLPPPAGQQPTSTSSLPTAVDPYGFNHPVSSSSSSSSSSASMSSSLTYDMFWATAASTNRAYGGGGYSRPRTYSSGTTPAPSL